MLANQQKCKRILGIDHSTVCLAFSLCVDGKIEYWEEIPLIGKDVFERVGYLHNELEKRFEFEVIDLVVIEKTAKINSLDTVIKMGFAAGSIIGYFAGRGIKVLECPAISWQAGTSKPTFTRPEMLKFKVLNPGKSSSWYKNEARKIRKQRIMNWVFDKFKIDAPTDASDAISISWYAWSKLI